MNIVRSVLVAFALVWGITSVPQLVHAQDKPNVVFMMMDNLGWGEIGAYGGGVLRGAPTPRLDALAEEGMKLLNFNVENQ